jgi:hypothetical protein
MKNYPEAPAPPTQSTTKHPTDVGFLRLLPGPKDPPTGFALSTCCSPAHQSTPATPGPQPHRHPLCFDTHRRGETFSCEQPPLQPFESPLHLTSILLDRFRHRLAAPACRNLAAVGACTMGSPLPCFEFVLPSPAQFGLASFDLVKQYLL